MFRTTGAEYPKSCSPSWARRGASFGKTTGSGLGIYHAKKTVESFGGRVEIRSSPGHGTTVTLSLPRAEPPAWFVRSLTVDWSTTVVAVDDDPSIHTVWKQRFASLSGWHGRMLHFTSLQQFADWHLQTNPSNVKYLFDYEFSCQGASGLNLIQELRLAEHSVLVTSHFDEKHLIERCESLGLRIRSESHGRSRAD
ncbi:MAG: hypothetical protein HC902_11065 [Calothrix sp. SM1_5_4]|nr:hypothetical protein [Calothrix sp. SM1_5_4]